MQDYRQLRVWKSAHRLVLAVYEATEAFPQRERYGLALQLRRASVSVASNIAEGASRATDRDFARFLDIARGSLGEVEYQVLLAGDLGYINGTAAGRLMGTISATGGMLTNLTRSVRGS